MKRRYLASILGALALLLAVGTATATAAAPGVQSVGQSAGSEQQATSASGATQINPSNTNISVRVLSDGNDGPVTQSNTASSNATSSNSNSTTQDASQDQGAGGIQTSTQDAGNAQLADASRTANQSGASNTNLPVRVLSPGSNGAVTQSNYTGSTAGSDEQQHDGPDVGSGPVRVVCGCAAAPSSYPDVQSTDGSCGCAAAPSSYPDVQSSDGSCGCAAAPSSPGVQSSDQSAENEQLAERHPRPRRSTRPTRTSCCRAEPRERRGSRPVQHGESKADADEHERHDADVRSGPVGRALRMHARFDPGRPAVQREPPGCACTLGRGPAGRQERCLTRPRRQQRLERQSRPVELGELEGRRVEQERHDADRRPELRRPVRWMRVRRGPGHPGRGSEGRERQAAVAGSKTIQDFGKKSECGCSSSGNSDNPVRVWSPGSNGSVDQSNSATSKADASNKNGTTQTADQDSGAPSGGCGCGGGLGIQVVGQKAENGQAAVAGSKTIQDFGKKSECGCSSSGNSDNPVRVWSPGSDGSVDQSNSVTSDADASNKNTTSQDGEQSQSGSGLNIQALGQESTNGSSGWRFRQPSRSTRRTPPATPA